MRKVARSLLPLLAASALGPAMLLTVAPATAQGGASARSDARMAAVLADPRRDQDRARDSWRHPAETLAFFRIAPGMTVADYMPSGGWYTRILVPYLGEQGRYIGIGPSLAGAGEGLRKRYGDFATRFPASAAGWTGVPAERIAAFTLDAVPDSLKGQVDRVMIMREVHNMWPGNLLTNDLAAIRAMLKDDGLLGIEEHRAKPDAPADYTLGTKGYMREADVIALIEAHGFRLVGKSEVNANPKDTANWPDGVWTLPPSLTLKDKDRAKYQAIGESDRMTLIFAKRR
ncbi:class I SAM-dependent methyltransferase [Novosphingobium piscinae]|uniref:Class I SAM-dependent methyltransferase n=1 Tax=Novosphingobium piscinae TaxID=1507448 RepID=A0A7X1FWV0_9SPHN|nr:class I SAM-dependent methyltransferase [Novosphingobium piscinae]MBC2668440.1 class I SAM-dependent methyltransferase [Novosphingobium piscinae]